ncbi:hypothetical protein [Tritonibacter aquimaris]|nr:hypothetical protein [Tritonibacter aquimaris]
MAKARLRLTATLARKSRMASTGLGEKRPFATFPAAAKIKITL